jgi:hypothetical protein
VTSRGIGVRLVKGAYNEPASVAFPKKSDVDANYFATAVDSAPLHALQNGTDGPNGVYRYGSSSGFPTESYGASNYWVDVIVSTNVGPDTTPPAVTGTVPGAGAAGVGTVTPVRATFSESVQPATVSVVLRDPANNVVPSSVAYDGPSRTATLTPDAPLAGGLPVEPGDVLKDRMQHVPVTLGEQRRSLPSAIADDAVSLALQGIERDQQVLHPGVRPRRTYFLSLGLGAA